jgi:hypothetical protein
VPIADAGFLADELLEFIDAGDRYGFYHWSRSSQCILWGESGLR